MTLAVIPPGWALLSPEDAARLVRLVRPAVESAERRREPFTGDVARLLDSLRRVAAGVVPTAVDVMAGAEVWLSTVEVSALLGIGTRQVRNLSGRVRRREVAGRLEFAESDVLDELAARAPNSGGSERKSRVTRDVGVSDTQGMENNASKILAS